jgi:hypothetical protein
MLETLATLLKITVATLMEKKLCELVNIILASPLKSYSRVVQVILI